MSGSLAAWWTARGPSLAYQNSTDQSIAYSLCNVAIADNRPVVVPGTAPYLFPAADDALPGTSLAVAGWTDDANTTWASLFYQTTSGDIANVQYTCNNQTGQYETSTAVNLTGRMLQEDRGQSQDANNNGNNNTSPDVLVPTGLAVVLLSSTPSSQPTGYRLFYHDRSSQVRMVHVSGNMSGGQSDAAIPSAVVTSLGIHAGGSGLFAVAGAEAADKGSGGDAVQQPTLNTAAGNSSFVHGNNVGLHDGIHDNDGNSNTNSAAATPLLHLASITASGKGIQLSSLDVDGNWSTLLTTIESPSWAGPPASLGLATAPDETVFFYMGSNSALQTLYWTGGRGGDDDDNRNSTNSTSGNSSSTSSSTISTGQESSLADSGNGSSTRNSSAADWPLARTPSGAFAMAVAPGNNTFSSSSSASSSSSSSADSQVWLFYQDDDGTFVQAHGQRMATTWTSPSSSSSSSSSSNNSPATAFTWDTTTVDQSLSSSPSPPLPSPPDDDSSPYPTTPGGICYGSCAHKALVLGVVLALVLAAAIVALVAARTWWHRWQWQRERQWMGRRGRMRRRRHQRKKMNGGLFRGVLGDGGGGGGVGGGRGGLGQDVFGRFGRGWFRIGGGGSRPARGTYTARNAGTSTSVVAGLNTTPPNTENHDSNNNDNCYYDSSAIKLTSFPPAGTASTLADGSGGGGGGGGDGMATTTQERRSSSWPTVMHALTTSTPVPVSAPPPFRTPSTTSGRTFLATPPRRTPSYSGRGPTPPLRTLSCSGRAPTLVSPSSSSSSSSSPLDRPLPPLPPAYEETETGRVGDGVLAGTNSGEDGLPGRALTANGLLTTATGTTTTQTNTTTNTTTTTSSTTTKTWKASGGDGKDDANEGSGIGVAL